MPIVGLLVKAVGPPRNTVFFSARTTKSSTLWMTITLSAIQHLVAGGMVLVTEGVITASATCSISFCSVGLMPVTLRALLLQPNVNTLIGLQSRASSRTL